MTVTLKSTVDTLLVVDGLSVRQGDRLLVDDVGLELERGRTIGIVGESGSGKSLTARAIVGLLPDGLSATGSVTFAGTQLLNAPERVLRGVRGTRISLLMQDPFTMLNPLQTAGKHIAESLPAGRDRQEIGRRLAEVGLGPDVASRYPFQLSGGMRQRVALAAALAKDPEVLVADEPTTALDVTTQDEVLRLLKEIQRHRGMALVLITHDLRVAFSVCDRIQVMYAGSVLERAPAAQLAERPAHPYTAGLLVAEPPAGHYVERLASIPGNVPSADSVTGQCAFAARCTWQESACVDGKPTLTVLDPDRSSACVRMPGIAADLVGTVAEQAVASPPPVPSGSAIVTVTGLGKVFRTRPLLGRTRTTVALDDVGFTINRGESLGLVGETGSGKTTIARSLLGLVTPDVGTIELDGIDASDYRKLSRTQRRRVRRFVQVVFQDPYASLNPALKVGSALREALEQRGGDPATEIPELLGKVGLPSSYADRLPSALSGGERQRVAIARAVAMRPEVLICDEPVAALDVSAQAQVLELLREIRRSEGMSMLFITHDLAVVRQMTDRMLVLFRGKVVEVGDTADVLAAPRDDYTRRLLAAVPGGAS
ncbi:ABC transporter ATP-binding protein [Amycolatopsis jejuensis]|uniref:dipeptide ABC transporter ATP-binding protein n=1 Tax=Amycolatopsis jejuensis TaxID=330084 RepID=UPI00052604E3|nr:ABC transporter ATP-binding protein [Amycolatopsis jejuensis]